MESTKEILKELEDITRRVTEISKKTGKTISINTFESDSPELGQMTAIYVRGNDDLAEYIEKLYWKDYETEWDKGGSAGSSVDLDSYDIYA